MMTKLVYDWGINDADYVTHRCPIYQCWKHMIERCYASHFSVRHPTYVGCLVDARWKYFMAFRVWYLEQSPKSGEQLDKDFLGNGKLYSPENCCFVSQWLNKLFNNYEAKRGKWPQGVSYCKSSGKYRAQMSCRGVGSFLGYFDTPEEASAVYLKAKAAYVEELLIEIPQLPLIETAIRRKMADLYARESTTQRPNTMPGASPTRSVPVRSCRGFGLLY